MPELDEEVPVAAVVGLAEGGGQVDRGVVADPVLVHLHAGGGEGVVRLGAAAAQHGRERGLALGVDAAELVPDGTGDVHPVADDLDPGRLVVEARVGELGAGQFEVGDVEEPLGAVDAEHRGRPVDAAVALDDVGADDAAAAGEVGRGHGDVGPPVHEAEGAHPLHGPAQVVRLRVQAPQVRGDGPHEAAAVVLVAAAQFGGVEAQVVREELGALVGEQVRAADVGEEVVGVLVDEDPVADAAELVAPVGDGGLVALALPHPPVDGGGEEGEGAGVEVRDGGEVGVLEEDALGEADAEVVEEVVAVELAGRDGVGEELGEGAEASDGLVPGVELRLPDGDLVGAQVDAQGAAGGDVGAGGERGGEQFLDGLEGQFVVGVEEHHVLAGGGLDAVVPGRSAAAAVLRPLDDPHPVVLGEPAGGEQRAVGGAVVDDQDLDVAVGLGEGRLEGAGERGARVVGGDDDADAVVRDVLRNAHDQLCPESAWWWPGWGCAGTRGSHAVSCASGSAG